MRYAVVRKFPSQFRAPIVTSFAERTAADTFLRNQILAALKTKRVWDAKWHTDDDVDLVSPTGRVLETWIVELSPLPETGVARGPV